MDHSAWANRVSFASGSATGPVASPWRRNQVEPHRPMKASLRRVCASTAFFGSDIHFSATVERVRTISATSSEPAFGGLPSSGGRK